MLRAGKGDLMDGGRGNRHGQKERGFWGQEGRWEAGRGRQGRNRRDGRCRPAGVDFCPGVQAIQYYNKILRIGCKKSV